ncbi:MAG: 2,3-bisphosphoglycerate-independent phosphoglycerate mutase [Candidatus Omnitrophica bacterium]|nr:2,3-bisphosphoglycerate-independent phosphoglycerate mutase [Candidatus Omnitrophota bacterium]
MKYIVVVIDGMSDHPCEELGGKTPLEVSKIPNLHYFTKSGKVGNVSYISERMEPTSALASLSLFGHNPKDHPVGLGPLEAANLEVKLEDNEVAFRLNFVTESQGVLADDTAGNITTKEAKALIAYLNKQLSSEFVKFFPGTGYRHIAVIKDAKGFDALSAHCFPPEQVIGEKIESHLPSGAGAELIKKLMYDTKLLLDQHEINHVRIDLKENPANMIWLWAQGAKPKLAKFSERFGGISGAMISVDDHMKGLARLMGLTVVDFPVDSEMAYETVADSMFEVLKEKDFVCVHIRSCDEASRAGNLKKKISSLEAIDYYVISALKAHYESEKEMRILITSFLPTPWKTKTYVRESVPFIVAGKNVVSDEIEKFSEATAKLSSLRFKDGFKLTDYLITGTE